MIKIGVISDTHIHGANEDIPKKVLEAFKKVDMVIHAGDLLDLCVLDKLKQVCKDVKAVCGNMDPAQVKNGLPEKEILKIGGYKIGIAHGCGHPAGLIELLKNIFKADKVDVIIFGHSHTAFNEKRDGILFFNPGSPTDKVFAPFNSYGILEVNDKIEGKIIRI